MYPCHSQIKAVILYGLRKKNERRCSSIVITPGCRRTADTGSSVSRDGEAVPVSRRAQWAVRPPARHRHWMTQHVAFAAPPPCPRSSLAIDVGE